MASALERPPVAVPIRVLLIEDARGYRETLANLLAHAPGYTCAGAFPNAAEALRQLPRLQADVALVDLSLEGMSGLDCIRRLRELQPGLHILVLTVSDDVDKVFAAVQAGAHGYLWKRTSFPALLEAIAEAHDGGAPITPHLARRMLEVLRAAPVPGTGDVTLTSREIEVLELLVRGHSNKEIARKLDRAVPTIKEHLRHIYEKFHVRSRAGAVARYLQSDRH